MISKIIFILENERIVTHPQFAKAIDDGIKKGMWNS